MSQYGKITFRGDFSYEWKIENFLKIPRANDQPFQSPILSVIDNNGRIGEICLYISKHVSLIVINVSKEELELKFRWGPYLDF